MRAPSPGLRRSSVTMFGTHKDDTELLDWSWVEERLTACEDYWLVSAPSGGVPAPRPVWGVWLDGRLLLTVGSPAHWRNVRDNPLVAVTTGDAREVVIVEGEATTEEDPAALAAMVAAYNPKYGWDFPETGPDIGGVISVRPTKVLAWITAPNAEAKTAPFPVKAARWVSEAAT